MTAAIGVGEIAFGLAMIAYAFHQWRRRVEIAEATNWLFPQGPRGRRSNRFRIRWGAFVLGGMGTLLVLSGCFEILRVVI